MSSESLWPATTDEIQNNSSWFIVTTVDCYSGQIILVYIFEGSETYTEQ